MIRTLFFVTAFILPMYAGLYAGEGQPSFLNIKFKTQHLYGIDVDGNNSRQENEKIYRRNQRYLRNALELYSKQTLRSIGLSNQTVNFMGASLRLVTKGAKLNLNESKTLAIHLDNVVTKDPALYFGYSLNW